MTGVYLFIVCVFFVAGWSEGNYDVRSGFWAVSLLINATGFITCCLGNIFIGLLILVGGIALFIYTAPIYQALQ